MGTLAGRLATIALYTFALVGVSCGSYGDDRGFPGTAAEYLDLLAGSGEVEVEADATSSDAGFVYLVGTNSVQEALDAEPRTTYDAAWGAADGGWLFASSAGSPEERPALATAFVAAVGSS